MDNIPNQEMFDTPPEDKNLHVKIRCELCGRLLLHQKVTPLELRGIEFIEGSVHPCQCVTGNYERRIFM